MRINTDSMGDLQVDLYFCDYARGVLAAGGLPVYLPFIADPADYAARLDGLLLTGGTDIDPMHYGQAPHPSLLKPEPERDTFELELLDGAVTHEIPVLGICRGVQMINVHGGGTLNQHVTPHTGAGKPTNGVSHRVDLTPGSLAESLYGPSLQVNSLHHQTIADIAAGFDATGVSCDGEIEVIESHDRPWLGVQWHPEMLDSRDDDPVFDWLVTSASG